MELADKRILVTGANGFIGSHLVSRLANEEAANVHALIRRNAPEPKRGAIGVRIQYVQGDVTDRDAVARTVTGCDIVIHTAACQPLSPLPPRSQFLAVNVGGTENLLRAFAPHGSGRFLLLSTINVHGLPPLPGADAESPLRYSGDRYSDSKVDGEHAAWDIARRRGIPLTVIRPACTFGPHGSAWTLQPLERIRRGTPVLIGDGRGTCNPIYVENLVDLVITALKHDESINQSFIGSQGIGTEWRDFFGYYGRMLGLHPRAISYRAATLAGLPSSIYEHLTGRPGTLSRASIAFYSHRVVFGVEKNARLLGYTPKISFEEGMRRTEAWLREEKLI